MTTPERSEKLGIWTKIGFGLGDIYGGGASMIISFYYLHFLTDVVRINPTLAGTAFLISKIYDAVTDPFEGVLTDRTRTPMGRRRPYLLGGIILVFLSFFLMWYPVNYASESGRFIYTIATYLFFSTTVSIVMISYNALASELTLDYNERTSLSSIRIFFSSFSSILAAVIPLEIVKWFPNDIRTGYTVMALCFGIFYALPFLATFFATKERPEFQKKPKPFNLRQTFIAPFKVRSFVSVLLMYLMSFVAMDTVSSIVIYFMKYYIGKGSITNYVNGALLITQVASIPFYVYLSKKTSKRTSFLVGCAVWMFSLFFSFLLGPSSPTWTLYAFAVAVGAGTGGIVVMIYAMFPDIPDIDELQSGERREGTYSSITSFMRKFSSAIALFLVSNALTLSGYVQPIEEVVNGVQKIVEQAQTPQFILFLRLLFIFGPIFFLIFAIIFALRYPLTASIHARLNEILEKNRKGVALSTAEQQEADYLKHLLIG
ncbi:MAG TPA: glycoside-pentoside-hexuronide (GPH):cation symporter [Anaerolineaceae bacterium]